MSYTVKPSDITQWKLENLVNTYLYVVVRDARNTPQNKKKTDRDELETFFDTSFQFTNYVVLE